MRFPFTAFTPLTSATRRAQQQRGFSLLEVMVGVAIGLIGIVVIFQVLQVWEERRRTTSSGSDAQVAGSIAMFNLERDIKQAGYGFGMSADMGCLVYTNGATYPNLATIPPIKFNGGAIPALVFPLVPVEIISTAGAPDSLAVLYGSSNFFTATLGFNVSTATTKKGSSRGGLEVGDQAVVAKDGAGLCAMVKITGYPNPDDGATLVHDAVNAAVGSFSSGTMLNLGANPQRNVWSIQGGRVLSHADSLRNPATWIDSSEGIIDLRAQYGYDDNGNSQIECPNGAGICEWTAAPLASPPMASAINWTKVRAVRVALLARGQQYEKNAVYTDPANSTNLTCTGNVCKPEAPKWAGGYFTMTNPADGTDWRHYRYRVYEQVIPLRNTIWGTAK
jgi:type IV pilus assembly protein PilW